MIKRLSFLFSILYCLQLTAIEYTPWFEEAYSLKIKPSYTYGNFNKLALGSGLLAYKSYNNFYALNLLTFPGEKWSLELESVAFQTTEHSLNFEYARASIKHQILDDITGEDIVSLALGATFTTPTSDAIHDLSTFHHWYFDSEVYLVVGKERSLNELWTERGYALFGVGSGTKGSCWLHGFIGLEKNICDEHFFRINAEYLKGLGQNNIINPELFNGYASINHISLDLGLGYSYNWFPYVTFSLDYHHRLYAKNFPYNANSIIASIWIPIAF
jgi:hypothetical protein